MKKLFLLFGIFALCSCGDDVTEINGYTEEELSMYLDSIMQEPETTFVYSKDTIIVTKKDTTVLNKKDTVVKVTKDTIVKYDTTVIKEIIEHKDTITYYPEEEKPRDTSITLKFDYHCDGQICSIEKKFEGFIYDNVFYENKLYNTWINGNAGQISNATTCKIYLNTSTNKYVFGCGERSFGICGYYDKPDSIENYGIYKKQSIFGSMGAVIDYINDEENNEWFYNLSNKQRHFFGWRMLSYSNDLYYKPELFEFLKDKNIIADTTSIITFIDQRANGDIITTCMSYNYKNTHNCQESYYHNYTNSNTYIMNYICAYNLNNDLPDAIKPKIE